MEIKGKVHCFFEQSGTFKNEFRKLGYEAYDYDIQNNFGETDYTIDLFAEIEKGYDGQPSIFDGISKDDLIMAFFPCIFFCEANARLFRFEDSTHRLHPHRQACDDMLRRSRHRERYFELALKMFCECDTRGLRLIVENPYSSIHYLCQYFPYRATVIDKDRSLRGDRFKKPTQYWFVNCTNTTGYSYQPRKAMPINKIDDRHRDAVHEQQRKDGFCCCSEEKSVMTPDYARNFICDFIIGKEQAGISQPSLFDLNPEP